MSDVVVVEEPLITRVETSGAVVEVPLVSVRIIDAATQGVQGIQGAPGAAGAAGQGVPTGGASGQALVKLSGTNYDTVWQTIVTSPAGSSGQLQFNNAGALGGTAAGVYAASGVHFTFTSQAAVDKALALKGASGQTANIFEVQNSSATALSVFGKEGFLGLGTSSPTSLLHTNQTLDGSTGAKVGEQHTTTFSQPFLLNNNCSGYQYDCVVTHSTDVSARTLKGNFYQTYLAAGSQSHLGTLTGFESLALNDSSSSKTVTDLYGFRSLAGSSRSGAITTNAYSFYTALYNIGTIGTGYGVFVDEAISSGGITTQYGLYVKELIKGATNWALYTDGATPSRFGGSVTLAEAANLVCGTTTGTKIGTATTQKLGFWNAAPIVQPTTSVAAATFVANTSGIANDTATFDGYTIGQVVKALRNTGLLA